jgi:uncharacterized protein (DUF433 family)
MPEATSVIHSDPETMSGTPVFVGTRMPVRILFQYLAKGHPLQEFLENYPGITKEQAAAALEEASNLLEAHAYSAGPVCSQETQAASDRS